MRPGDDHESTVPAQNAPNETETNVHIIIYECFWKTYLRAFISSDKDYREDCDRKQTLL